MQVENNNAVEVLTRTNTDQIQNVYRLISRVMDIAIYQAGKEEGSALPSLISSSGKTNSELIQEIASTVTVAMIREKYKI